MARASMVCCCCAVLAGCQVVPLGLHPTPPPPRPVLEIFGETVPLAADRGEDRETRVKQVVLRHIPPGTPVDRAQAMLAEQGFTCRPYTPPTSIFHSSSPIPAGMHLNLEALTRVLRDRKPGPVYCYATRQDLGEWHLRSYQLLVVLLTGGTDTVVDVEVGLKREDHPNEFFFRRRPDLHEPVGLTVEEARARMTAAGFRCTAGTEGSVLCEAFDEWLLGGDIVRVSLHPDSSGVIRETRVLRRGGWFDAERCMLPHGDESASQALCKRAVFPLRVGCRYTLIPTGVAVILFMGLMAYPYGH